MEDLLRPESFYAEENRHYFAAILGVREKGATVDVLAVHAWLKDHGRSEQSGTTDHIGRMVRRVALGAEQLHAPHVQRISELHRLRMFIDETRALLAQAYVAHADVPGFLARAEATVREVTQRGEKRSGELIETAVNRVLREAAFAMKAPGRMIGMPTGIDGIDRRTAEDFYARERSRSSPRARRWARAPSL